ncbi:hypothetical protein H6P81_009816 [Aristolochia fimbriata]|uniref:Ribosomal protein L2 n=1 Tax=Aristolochia fimbriata TaxID=158543 RepID=A0AAV7EQ77_ARIFI|nr:hypothetical protein H6P81_009816 [Aristolochia fimbriata]
MTWYVGPLLDARKSIEVINCPGSSWVGTWIGSGRSGRLDIRTCRSGAGRKHHFCRLARRGGSDRVIEVQKHVPKPGFSQSPSSPTHVTNERSAPLRGARRLALTKLPSLPFGQSIWARD